MPRISLITSLYQSALFLPQYIAEAEQLAVSASKAGLDLELVIVPNDADDTERRLLSELEQKLLSQQTARIQVHHVGRESLYASWNRGIESASGQIIGVWNVDDLRYLPALLEARKLLLDEGYDLVDFAFAHRGQERIIHSAEYRQNSLSPKTTLSPFWMAKRDFILSTGGFNAHFRIVGDFEWSKRPQVRAAKFTPSDIVAGDFIVHESNLSGKQRPLEWVEYNTALIWHGGLDDLRPVDPQLMKDSWQAWGHTGGTMSEKTADFLLGDGAEQRYQQYQRERNQHPLIRRLRLALARRGLIHSVEWSVHHG